MQKFLLSLLLLISGIPAFSSVVDEPINGSFYYLNEDTHTATLAYPDFEVVGSNTDYVIPSGFHVTGYHEQVHYTVTGINGLCFRNLDVYISVHSITIPRTVTRFGGGAWGCSDVGRSYLGKVNILSDLTSWCNNTFYGIYSNPISFGDFYLNGEKVEQLNIPPTVHHIPNFAFRNSGIKSLTLPGTVTTIGDGAFEHCTIKTLDIPESVTSIGVLAFNGCGITKLTLPSSVTSIGHGAFSRNSLKHIYSHITEPQKIKFVTESSKSYFDGNWGEIKDGEEANVFADIYSYFSDGGTYGYIDPSVYANCVLHVPQGTSERYKASAMFKKFEQIVEMGDEGDLNGDGQVDVSDVSIAIDIVLGKADYDALADLDGNGSVDVTDVSMIIDIVLGK